MTILASPMLETLDVALHEDVFTFAEVKCRAKMSFSHRGDCEVVTLHKFEAVSVKRRLSNKVRVFERTSKKEQSAVTQRPYLAFPFYATF